MAGLRVAAGGVQAAREHEGRQELNHLRGEGARRQAQARDQAFGRRLEGEAERLVPPAAPPARQSLVQHGGEGAEGVRVHPGAGARADDARAQEADEEDGGQRKDGGESPFDGVEGDEEPEDAGQHGRGADEGGEEGGCGRIDDAPEVGVVYDDDLEQIQNQVARQEGGPACAQRLAARLRLPRPVGPAVVVRLGGHGRARVRVQLLLHPARRRRKPGNPPVPSHAAEVAEDVGNPVQPLDEGREREVLPGEGAFALARACRGAQTLSLGG